LIINDVWWMLVVCLFLKTNWFDFVEKRCSIVFLIKMININKNKNQIDLKKKVDANDVNKIWFVVTSMLNEALFLF